MFYTYVEVPHKLMQNPPGYVYVYVLSKHYVCICTIEVCFLVYYAIISSDQPSSKLSICTFLTTLLHKILPTVVNCTKIDANFIRVYPIGP